MPTSSPAPANVSPCRITMRRSSEGDAPSLAKLAVYILDQMCDTLGYMGYWPFLFHLEDYFPQPATVLIEIEDGHVLFADDVHIPVRPVIGTIGVAPALEAMLSGSMGRHCGNVDVQEIAAGS